MFDGDIYMKVDFLDDDTVVSDGERWVRPVFCSECMHMAKKPRKKDGKHNCLHWSHYNAAWVSDDDYCSFGKEKS